MRFETSGQGSKNRIFTPFGDLYIDVENLFDQVMGNNPFACLLYTSPSPRD